MIGVRTIDLKKFTKYLLIFVLIFSFAKSDKVNAAEPYDVVYSEVTQFNGNAEQAEWITQAIFYSAELYGVDPILLASVMETESSFYFNAYSSAGAIGLMQLMPETANMVGVDPYDPLDNVIGGASYLRTQLDNFSGYGEYAVTNAVAAYNAGGNAVRKYGGCPPYNETINYVYKVADVYNRLSSQCDY